MRFAWLRETEYPEGTFQPKWPAKVLFILYNVVWWIPVILAFTKAINYRAGFIAFFIVTLFRGIANAYRINVLRPEKAMVFPFRSP